MIGVLCPLLALLAAPTLEQDSEKSTLISPCPDVFMYEPPGPQSDRWYGVVTFFTHSTLDSLRLEIVLDNNADTLGNWIGPVTTHDHKNFKIESADIQISPLSAVAVHFFVQYHLLKKAPRLVAIRLNDREICSLMRNPLTEGLRPFYSPDYDEYFGVPLDLFVNLFIRILQKPKYSNSDSLDEQQHRNPKSEYQDNEYLETENQSSQSTIEDPKAAPTRKTVNMEDQMIKTAVDVHTSTASTAVKDATTTAALVSSTTDGDAYKIRALSSFLALMLAARSSAQTTQVSDFVSPCPNVFSYDPLATESNKWYGVVNLTTDIPLYALWLNIVLENKANILGNWLGEVTTDDNIDFKIENTNMSITPEQPLAVRFFIQYNANSTPPKLKAIRFNGREICRVENQVGESAVPVRSAGSYEEVRPGLVTSTTARPTVTTTSRNYNLQQTTLKAQYWYQTEKPQTTTNSRFWTQTTPKPTTTTTLKSQYWTEAQTPESKLRTTQTQYWQQTTPTTKPIYWTQAKGEVNPQTTVRTPGWSYVKADNNQQVTSTFKPTNQTRSQTRNETALRISTENNSVAGQVQTLPNSQTKDTTRTTNSQGQLQVQNNQQTTSGNKYQRQNGKVPGNQNVSSTATRPSNFQIEVKQVGNTKYWSKIPENTTRVAVKTESTAYGWSGNQQRGDSGLQNQPYAKISIKQSEFTNPDQLRDTPLYVRPGDRQTISDSRYEPKNNVENRPQPYSGVVSEIRRPARPVTSYQQTTTQRQQNTDDDRPLKISGPNNYDESYQPFVEPTRIDMVVPSGVESSRYPISDGGIKSLDGSSLSFDDYQMPIAPPVPTPNKIETYDNLKSEEFYEGGLPIFLIPNSEPPSRAEIQPTCGKVLLNKQTAQSLESSSTLEGQWPWQIALYQQQVSVELHYKYICGGTLVSRSHIITAAHCVTRKSTANVVNRDTLVVFLGKHHLRTSVEGVEVKFVYKILIYPDYDPTNLRTDLAILELRDSVTFSSRIQPVCLWPEQETALKNVVGKKGYTFGWGYDVSNLPREELAQLQMVVVDQQTCLSSHPEFFSRFISDKTYCAGFSSTATCNGRDSGGGMVFRKGDSWYLRGVVSLLVARQGPHNCDPNRYVIFTDVAKFLPWILDNIEDL